MTPLSAVIITKDEEARLAEALDSVAFCDEVLVLDAGSTDATCSLAAERGARVLTGTPWPGFVEQRTRAVQAARHDWILAIDADERVTPALRAEIQSLQALDFDGTAGFRIPRLSHYLDTWVRHTDWYPDPQLRLFDRRCGGWQGGLVHESVQVSGPVGRLRGELHHFPYRDIADHLRRIDHYTTLWARQAYADGRRCGAPYAFTVAVLAFLRNYLLKGGALLGGAGIVISTLNAYYTFAKLVKLRELSHPPR